jgi:signal transduction histidine kinase
MATVSRSTVAALFAVAIGSAGAGLWLQTTGGGAMPGGFLQYTAVVAGTATLGAFVLWHRSRNRYGLIHLSIGVLFGTVVLAAGVLSRAGTGGALPNWAEEVALAWSWIAAAALLPLWVLAIAAFPDGRLHRDVIKRSVSVLAIAMPLLAVIAYVLAPSGAVLPLIQVELLSGMIGPLAPADGAHFLYRLASGCASVLGGLAPVAAVVALIDRFRRAAPVQRQQIKWLLVGAAMSVAFQAIPVNAIESDALRTAAGVLVIATVPLPFVAAAFAIFRHRLWDIDLVVSKGLVYALVSGVLTALFLGIALVAGVSVGGRDSQVIAALGLALLVSFLAQPLRQRAERLVARLLYGDEPRGLMALARLGEAGTDALDAGDLGSRIADAAKSALGASWVGVWLYVGGDRSETLRPLAMSGPEPGPAAFIPGSVPAALTDLSGGVSFADLPSSLADSLRPLFTAEPALLAPLTSTTGELVGLIACGGRPKDPFGREDLELFGLVARESALALRNIRLEEELRERLEQIEQQALELHSSRQRLVAAQDHERRRIERDLHDGAQQQLVALAARLRRAALAQDQSREPVLEELADLAEESVFALQELARGIYPSLLADRGLQAAMQAHAARVPAKVRVEVGPLMQGRRLDADLEAAFYFVALEALTNAVKHAPGADIIVSLRADPARCIITLEVHDDGPGFDTGTSASGSGLQNMADRIAALGGSLSVESVPGGGTWIRAELREQAEIRQIGSREETL